VAQQQGEVEGKKKKGKEENLFRGGEEKSARSPPSRLSGPAWEAERGGREGKEKKTIYLFREPTSLHHS